MKKQAILLSTHIFNDYVCSAYHRLNEEISEDMDLFLLLEVENEDFVAPEGIHCFPFTVDTLNTLNYEPIAETIIPGSNHFQVLLFYKNNPIYDYYWNIEYDVYFHGHWRVLFDRLKTVTSDFLSSHLERYPQTPEWAWWNSLKLKTINIPKEQYIKSFNPIYRISNEALRFLDKILSEEGNEGHHEALIPTVLHHAGFTVNDFGGIGEFVLPGYENTAYLTSSDVNNLTYMGSSMRFRPVYHIDEIKKMPEDNKLFHPVKFITSQPANENKILIIGKSDFFELRKRLTLGLIPKLSPLETVNSTQYIISLTSYGKRLVNTAPYAIVTLLNQNVKPDKVVLWISREEKEKIPQTLYDLTSKGLEILLCEDVKSYKKLVFTLEMYQDDYIITADDDVYYPQNWFEQLLSAHKSNLHKIICHRARGIRIDEHYNPYPFLQWDNCIEPSRYFSTITEENHQPESIFPIGMGGILYPPGCFHKDITNKSLFLNLAPKGDDIWFWAMAVLNQEYFCGESPFVVIENGYSKNIQEIDPAQMQGDDALWNYNSQGGNDIQINNVLAYYPQIKEYLRKIKPCIERSKVNQRHSANL